MKRFFIGYRPLSSDLASLLLRLIFGGLFIWTGWVKIDNYDKYIGMMQDYIGIGARLSYNLVIFAEFFCGILVTLGILTRLAVLPIIFAMIVVYFIALKTQPFEQKEIALVFLVMGVVIFIMGSGRFSIDYIFQNKKPSAERRMV
jgi:putative oxidoreductase